MSKPTLSSAQLITIADELILFGTKFVIVGDEGDETQAQELQTLLYERDCLAVTSYWPVITEQELQEDELPKHMSGFVTYETWAHGCLFLTDFTHFEPGDLNNGQNACVTFSLNNSKNPIVETGCCHMIWNGTGFATPDTWKSCTRPDTEQLKFDQVWPGRIQAMYPETAQVDFSHILPLPAIPDNNHNMLRWIRSVEFENIVAEIKQFNYTHIAWLSLDEGLQAPFVSNAQVLSDMLVHHGHIKQGNVLYFTADECAEKLYENLMCITKPLTKMKMCSTRSFEYNTWAMADIITLVHDGDPNLGTRIPFNKADRTKEEEDHLKHAITFSNAPRPKTFLSFNRMPRGPRVGVLASLISTSKLDTGYYSLCWDDEHQDTCDMLVDIAKEELASMEEKLPGIATREWAKVDWARAEVDNMPMREPVDVERHINILNEMEVVQEFFKARNNKSLVLDSETVMEDNPVNSTEQLTQYYKDTYYSIVHESMFYSDQQHGDDPNNIRAHTNSQGRWNFDMYGSFGGNFFSEKLFKPMLFKQPFIFAGRPHSLKLLQASGYKTFNGVFDESYDEEENDIERLWMINEEIHRLNNFSANEWREAYTNVQYVVEHNYNHFCSGRRLAVAPDNLNKYILRT
jgi:hypothetical protein